MHPFLHFLSFLLESTIDERSHGLRNKDENVRQLEMAIQEKLDRISLLQIEIEYFQVKVTFFSFPCVFFFHDSMKFFCHFIFCVGLQTDFYTTFLELYI